MWQVFLVLSILIIASSSIYVLLFKNKNIKSISIIPSAVFISNTLIFLPIYYVIFKNDAAFPHLFKTVFVSMHHAIRLFIVDSDFEIIKEMVPSNNKYFYYVYTCYASILFFISPMMTFSFIFSFFKNISARRKYFGIFNKDAYIFSEFNEESIALATSIKENFCNSAIVFTSVSDESIKDYSLYEKAQKIDAIMFEKNILAPSFKFHNKNKNIVFFLIDKDEASNINNALEIIAKYNKRKNTSLYVFSNGIEGELFLSNAKTDEIKLRRISNTRSLIYSILKNKGKALFEEACEDSSKNKKLISAVVVGIGQYGTEMTKSLAWFCQMEGYRIAIDAFDIKPDRKDYISSLCPELMDERFNNKFDDPGESQYRISIHQAIDVNSSKFQEEIKKLGNATYVFVSLGNDEINIRTSIMIRRLFEQIDIHPRIQTIIENAESKSALIGIKNYSGQFYDIDYVGAIDEIYSYDNILNSELEREALNRHLCWGKEEDFWKYEYNYRASMASALHKRMKIFCGVPGIDKKPSERTEEEKHILRLLEHRRWNAYMRSEGYVYSEKRNNLAKTHNCLVTFDLLSQKDKEKDDD